MGSQQRERTSFKYGEAQWHGSMVLLLSKDQIKDRSEPHSSHGKQPLYNPFVSDLSSILVSVQLEQRSAILVVGRLVKLLRPDPVAGELVNRRSPTPRADGAIICFAGLPLGLKDDLIATTRGRRVGGGAFKPRVEFVCPGLVDTLDEDLANQRVVRAPVEVLLDSGGERFFPLIGGGFNGPLDDLSIPNRVQVYFKGSGVLTYSPNNECHLLAFFFPHRT